MSHLIACPECGKHLQVPEDLLGRDVQCPECRHTFTALLAGKQEETPPVVEPAKPPTMPAWDEKTDVGPAKSRRKRQDDDDDRDDDDLDVRRRGGDDKPGKVTSIGVMALVGGILALSISLAWMGATCCLWPGLYYSLVMGILAIIKGAALLGADAASHPPPIGIGVMMIINVINLDVVCLTLGIIILVFCADEEVKEYMAH